MKPVNSNAICVLLGNPVAHSLSPIMHNKAFKELGLDMTYYSCQVSQEYLEDAVKGIKALGIIGANVTIPYKEKVIPFLDRITPMAESIGAVNTILSHHGQLIGHNTDGMGFVYSLKEEGFQAKGKTIAILGAGGAAKGIAVALAAEEPAEINIIVRTTDKGQELKNILQKVFSKEISVIPLQNMAAIDSCLQNSHLLVNTTPVGMHPHVEQEPLITLNKQHSHLVVADLIYNPLKTKLLTMAKQLGCKTISGLGMFIHQGALAFELWTQQKAPIETMRKAVMENLDRNDD